jgi:SHS2 domain-containing protein
MQRSLFATLFTMASGDERGWRQLDHTADLALELWATSEEALLEEGARAIVSVLTEGAHIDDRDHRDIRLETVDDEDRLVQWLNEILYSAVSHGFLFSGAEITLSPAGLSAQLRGQADAGNSIKTELKSATYHDLTLERTDGGWRAQVVIDV